MAEIVRYVVSAQRALFTTSTYFLSLFNQKSKAAGEFSFLKLKGITLGYC